jgi:hypothetical protein
MPARHREVIFWSGEYRKTSRKVSCSQPGNYIGRLAARHRHAMFGGEHFAEKRYSISVVRIRMECHLLQRYLKIRSVIIVRDAPKKPFGAIDGIALPPPWHSPNQSVKKPA